jgi:hypothetical protein
MGRSSVLGNGHTTDPWDTRGTSPAGPGRTVDRRTALVGAAATVLGVGRTTTARAATPHTAALSAGGVFDLTGPSTMFLREKRARDVTVLQSIAFDDTNGVLFVAQVMQKDRRLAGESAPVSGTRRLAHGDVTVSRLSYTGQLLSWMYLRGFGHPVGIGVEPVGSSAYLWLGTASTQRTADGVGYPTRVGRVRFVPGAVMDYPSTAVQVYQPVQGAREVSVSFDALNRTLLVRYLLNGAYRYRLYGLDAFKARNYQPLYSRTETGISDIFQGHAHFYGQVYRLEGRSGGVTASPTHVSRFDLPSGTTTQRTVTRAALTLTFREPQGMAVQLKPLRLHMGFADGVTGGRNLSIYYKDRFISQT